MAGKQDRLALLPLARPKTGRASYTGIDPWSSALFMVGSLQVFGLWRHRRFCVAFLLSLLNRRVASAIPAGSV